LAQLFILGDAGVSVLAAGSFLTAGWVGFLLYSTWTQAPGTQPPPFLEGFLASVLSRTGLLCLFILYFSVLNVPAVAHPSWLLFLEHLGVVLLLGIFGWAARRGDLLEAASFLGLAQFGFFFAGLLLGNKAGLTGALMELLSQTLVMAGIFFAAGTLKVNAGPQPLSRLAGLARRRPWTGMALIVLTASIAGVPPTAGFFGKYYLVLGALEKGDQFLLAVLGATLFFNWVVFLRFLLLLFEHRGPASPPEPPARGARLPALLLAAGILALGLFHQTVLTRFIEPALPKAFLELPSPYVPFLGNEVE
jgi:multicomponent Na+:H+ antiporter subunit D